MFQDLSGKDILIIGASRGIGYQLAQSLKTLGANLYLTVRSADDQDRLAREFDCQSFICDLSGDESIQALASQVPSINGVCVVGGQVKLVPPKLLSRKNVEPQIFLNLVAPLLLIGALLKNNKIKNGGSIVFTSAGARLNQVNCSSPYAAAKLGLYGAGKSLAADLSSKKIRVNTVSFDYVNTDMIKGIKTSEVGIVGISPVEYTSFPYMFLLSEMSSWTTGQIIAADAGRMLGKVRYA